MEKAKPLLAALRKLENDTKKAKKERQIRFGKHVDIERGFRDVFDL